MQILHTTSFINQKFTSDAHIFSIAPINGDIASDLLYAQLVVEAKWLGEFPTYVFMHSGEDTLELTPLFEDVRLVYPEGWNAIDKASAFLMNKQMYDLCKAENADFYQLAHSTADELRALFEDTMFVVATVGSRDANR